MMQVNRAMIEPGETPSPPARRAGGHAVWFLRMGLFLLGWAGVEWVFDSAWKAQMDWQPFQQHANKTMWAYEAASAGDVMLGDWLTGSYTADQLADRLREEYRDVLSQPGTEWLGTELALVLHRVAVGAEDPSWSADRLEEAKEWMESQPKWTESDVQEHVRKLLRGEKWEGEEKATLSKLRTEWPEWWTIHHLGHQGLDGGKSTSELPAPAHAALRDLQLTHFMSQLAALLGLAGIAVWFWLMKDTAGERRSIARLAGLWKPERMIIAFAASSLFAKAAITIFAQTEGLSFNWLLGEGMPAWWLGQAANQLFHLVLTAFPAYVLLAGYVRKWRWYAPVLQLRAREFRSPRLWLKAWCLAGLILTATTGVSMLLEVYSTPSGVADWVSRSMYGWGDLALPLALFWGAVVAPLVEEVIFRGLLFRSLRNRFQAPVACLISSLIFAASHGYSLVGFVSVLLMGAAFCWIYHRSGSLALAIMTHSGINMWFAMHDFIWLG